MNTFLHSQWRWFAFAERPQAALFQRGITALNCSMDYIHCKYLGLDSISYGSTMQLLTVHMLPGSPFQSLQVCWQYILASYKSMGIVERYRGMRKLILFQRKNSLQRTPDWHGVFEEKICRRSVATLLLAVPEASGAHKFVSR